MTDKSQLVLKMNPSASSGHHGASHTSHLGQQKPNRNESRGNRSGRGKECQSSNGRERGGNLDNSVPDLPRPPKTRGHTKKAKLVNDFVSFDYYQPQPRATNYSKSHKPASNYVKEDYVNVSCQFVIDQSNQNVQTVIDSCVEWQHVIQVRLPCEELSLCPICLYPPVCPLSPACGHLMCYSCVLRFQENCPGGDCPICHHPLLMSDFRPLKTFPRRKFVIGDEIVMKLVSRSRNGRIVCPIDEQNVSDSIPNLSSTWGSQFSHVVSASEEQVLYEVLLPQEDELKTQLAMLDEGEMEADHPYIIKALEKVCDQKVKCYEKIESAGLKKVAKHNMAVADNKRVYFYQSDDGQPIFLHPLNSRCLIHENGSIQNCPPEIHCTIIATEHYTQSPETRSRYRYFSHLSLGCPFILCEVEIRPFISDETFEHFKGDLERRFRTRHVKERKENAYSEKLSRKLAEKEVTYHCSASVPRLTEVTKPANNHFMSPESYDLLTDSPNSSSDAPLSFAEKLSAGTRKQPRAITNLQGSRARINSTSSDISHGSDTGVPSYHQSFSASLGDAFASLEIKNPAPGDETSGSGLQSGRKKKKKKGKTISLTGGARRC